MKYYYSVKVNGNIQQVPKSHICDLQTLQNLVGGGYFEIMDMKVKDNNNKLKNIKIYCNENGRTLFDINHSVSNFIKEKQNNKFFIGSIDDKTMLLGIPDVYGNVVIECSFPITSNLLNKPKPHIQPKTYTIPS